MKKLTNFLSLLIFSTSLFSQNPVAPTAAADRMKGVEMRQKLDENSLVKNLPARAIGPSIFSCRVNDVDVNPADPTHFFVAYASGGLWKTESNGTDFTPLFDHEASMTIGDVAVDWKRNIIWLGTGENNSSRSSYAGTGMYRSTDSGKTWQPRGLDDSHHIGRIILHPTNPDILWVAALGHLYSPNRERGIFKTTDGGATWKNVLFVNENAGGIDLVIDPTNPQNLWGATWERERRAWNFDGSGPGSGIWKSTDGGDTWQVSGGPKSGFPSGDLTGRIGLDIFQKEGKTVLFAVLDNQNPLPEKEKKEPEKDILKKEFFKTATKENVLEMADEKLDEFLRSTGFPEIADAVYVKKQVKTGKIQPSALFDWLDSGDDGFQKTGIYGCEIYRSDDLGATWQRTHKEPIEQVFFTYGYYFAQIRVARDNPQKLYVLGVPIIRSDDGGATWKSIDADNVHGDHHALWVNPARPGHLVNGNDGGINLSYDDGKTWFKCNNPPVGQFYAINVDGAEPYNVYGGLQDNGVWWGPSNSELSTGWQQGGQYPFKFIYGGDGMQVMIDPRDNSTVYTGAQFGNYGRVDKKTGDQSGIQPEHELGERPLRFNWQSPIWLSKHQPDILYFGSNRLHRSLNQGEKWESISPDLTGGGQKGNVPFGTLTAIHESPLKFGMIYTGSDDGLIYRTGDGGETWKKISDNLPKNLWVSRVQASAFEKNRVYASLNGYRWDDFESYIYASENGGDTWERIGLDLPAEPVNVVREDPVNENLLYVGTDHGLYCSLDRGKTFQKMSKDLPAVAVHDLVVQPKTNELVVGTHGRSLYILPVGHLQKLDSETRATDFVLFDIPKKRWSGNWGRASNKFTPIKEPELKLVFWSKMGGDVEWEIKSKGGLELKEGKFKAEPGLNTLIYNLDFDEKKQSGFEKELSAAVAEKDKKKTKPVEFKKADSGKFYLAKGTYSVELEMNKTVVKKEFTLDGGRGGEPEPGAED